MMTERNETLLQHEIPINTLPDPFPYPCILRKRMSPAPLSRSSGGPHSCSTPSRAGNTAYSYRECGGTSRYGSIEIRGMLPIAGPPPGSGKCNIWEVGVALAALYSYSCSADVGYRKMRNVQGEGFEVRDEYVRGLRAGGEGGVWW